MRVSQIKSVASKIYEEIRESIHKEREDYYLSYDYASALAEFKANDPLAKTIIAAYNFMQSDELNLIEEVRVYLNVVRPRRSYNFKTIGRDDDLNEILKSVFDNSLRFNYSYSLPDSVEQIFNMLEYRSITSSNILDIEREVKAQFVTDAGRFSAYREES